MARAITARATGSVGGRRFRGAVSPPSPRGAAARERGPPTLPRMVDGQSPRANRAALEGAASAAPWHRRRPRGAAARERGPPTLPPWSTGNHHAPTGQRWRAPLPRRRVTAVASGRGRAGARPSNAASMVDGQSPRANRAALEGAASAAPWHRRDLGARPRGSAALQRCLHGRRAITTRQQGSAGGRRFRGAVSPASPRGAAARERGPPALPPWSTGNHRRANRAALEGAASAAPCHRRHLGARPRGSAALQRCLHGRRAITTRQQGSVGGRRFRGAVSPPRPRGAAARERGPPTLLGRWPAACPSQIPCVR